MSACVVYACEVCPLTFETGNLRTKHKYEVHSEIGSITVDGIELPCLQTSDGLLKCPSSNCPNYQKMHRSTFMKHLLKYNMKSIATKCAAPSNSDSSHCYKKAKVTEGKLPPSSLVALNIISCTLTAVPDNHFDDMPTEDSFNMNG